ncbi:MAG: HD domain-containing protein [Chloroflexi bacterium]|nr:HD domain-containing protein [Chloroflexota bacterium]
MQAIEEITEAMLKIGGERYGEDVNQLQHGLQCAALAETSGASAELITAALLHDIGHVVDLKWKGAAEAGIDRRHEDIGAAYLAKWFGPEVTEPVRMHVAAKRYLCAVDAEYFSDLSFGSVRSLELQGGSFDGPEATAFVNQPFAKDAIQLRRWDDLAKDPGARTESLDYFMSFARVALQVHAKIPA